MFVSVAMNTDGCCVMITDYLCKNYEAESVAGSAAALQQENAQHSGLFSDVSQLYPDHGSATNTTFWAFWSERQWFLKSFSRVSIYTDLDLRLHTRRSPLRTSHLLNLYCTLLCIAKSPSQKGLGDRHLFVLNWECSCSGWQSPRK